MDSAIFSHSVVAMSGYLHRAVYQPAKLSSLKRKLKPDTE